MVPQAIRKEGVTVAGQHYCTECRMPVRSWEWGDLAVFTGSTEEHLSEPPTLYPCGHQAETYTEGETLTYSKDD